MKYCTCEQSGVKPPPNVYRIRVKDGWATYCEKCHLPKYSIKSPGLAEQNEQDLLKNKGLFK